MSKRDVPYDEIQTRFTQAIESLQPYYNAQRGDGTLYCDDEDRIVDAITNLLYLASGANLKPEDLVRDCLSAMQTAYPEWVADAFELLYRDYVEQEE